MPNPVPLPPPGFDDLSVEEKLDYLQSLWDRRIGSRSRTWTWSTMNPNLCEGMVRFASS
jgi:hypothetical protein